MLLRIREAKDPRRAVARAAVVPDLQLLVDRHVPAVARKHVGGREPHHSRTDDGDLLLASLAEKWHHGAFLPTRFRSTPRPSTSSSPTCPGCGHRPSPGW